MTSANFCPSGHPQTPGALYCATCGTPLQFNASAPSQGGFGSSPNRGLLFTLVGLSTAVVLVLVVIVALVVSRSDSGSTTAEDDQITVLVGYDDADCDYAARYFEGGDVILLDSRGNEIGQAILAGEGTLDADSRSTWCYWTLEFTDVPESASYSVDYEMPGGVIAGQYYEIEGRVTVTGSELRASENVITVRWERY